MKKFKLIKFSLYFFILLTVLYLILSELTSSFNGIKKNLEEINIKYLIIGVIFSAFFLLFNSYALLLLYRSKLKIGFNEWNTYLFKSYILDHIPFLGLFYRARKFKKKKNLYYNNFIVLHFFAILINFFLMLILIKFFLLNEDYNFFKIDLEILNLIIVLYFIFLLFIYNFVKLKSLLDNLGNNSIFHKLLGKFTNFFLILSSLQREKLLTLKFSILIMITHLFGLIFFFTIFRTLNFTLDLNIQILIYLIFNISTLIKILPKNYVISEYVGASLIGKTEIGFVGGLLFFILHRFLNIVCILLLFFYFSINYYLMRKKII